MSNFIKTQFFAMISLLLFLSTIPAQTFTGADYDTVTARRFDTGKMWTFDVPPYDYFEDRYDFRPSEEWIEDVRLSALRFGGGCSASFISEDGLIMTNNHCARGIKERVAKEDEDFIKNGFYADSLSEERKVPGLTVKQLKLIKDVTDQIIASMDSGKTDDEKVKLKKEKISELETNYNEETGLNCNVESFYNGGKYSIYGYKVYDDIRLVFIPEEPIAYFGGDFDNFTYPRYNLDCAFFRAYDDEGDPIQVENYFEWSLEGAPRDDVIFTVGNPGRTSRLVTTEQLKYNRDIRYRNIAFLLDKTYNALEELKKKNPDKAEKYEDLKLRIGNAQKVYVNIYKGLTDDYLMARKKAFQEELKDSVFADDVLRKKYGMVWEAIHQSVEEKRRYSPKISAYDLFSSGFFSRYFVSEYLKTAKNIYTLAKQLKKPEEERLPQYKGDKLDSVKESIYSKEIDQSLDKAKLKINLDYIKMNLGSDSRAYQLLTSNLTGDNKVEALLGKTILTSKEKIEDLLDEDPEEILNYDDPFIKYVAYTQPNVKGLSDKMEEVTNSEEVYQNMLGRAMYEVYGTSIPPDANGTLRLSDGVLKSFDYNGTKAIVKTNFFGMYDRYYGNNKEYPWNLSERWQKPPKDLDMLTPYNFISTNDIVGGNSGSAVINRNAEVVGLAFDGNIKSNIGNFLYMPKDNRCVSVSALGMYEAIKNVYKAQRLADEMKNGELSE